MSSIVVKTPPLLYNVEHLVSSAMEMPLDFRYAFRLCASIIFAITRTAGDAALSHTNHRAIQGDQRVKGLLGWPFTSAYQERATTISLSSEEAVQIIAALEAALRRLAAVAVGTTTLDVSVLAFCTSSSNMSSIGRRESLHVEETSAMIEVVTAYVTGGGVWPDTGPRTVRPTTIVVNKDPLIQRVLLHLRDSGEDGRGVLHALLGDQGGLMLSKSTSSSACTKLALCTPSAATEAASPRFEEASTPIGNTMAEKPATTSRVDMLCMHGGKSKVSFAGVSSRSPTNNESAQQQCGMERRAQDATSSQRETCEGSPDRNRSRGSIAAGSLAKPVEESPLCAGKSPPRDAAEADSSSTLVIAPARRRRRHRLDTITTTTTTTTPVNGSTSAPSYPKRSRWFHLPWSQVAADKKERGLNDAKGKSTPLLDDIPATDAADAESQPNASVTPYPSPTASAHDQSTTSTVTGRSRVKPSAASCSGGPRATSFPSTSSPRSGAPAASDPYPVRSSSPSRQRLLSARTLVHSGNEEEEEEEDKLTVAAAATSSERSAAVVPPPTASDTTPSTATVGATAAVVASSDGLPPSSASPRGRRRVPSPPRGRPCSPGQASPLRNAASSPSSPRCASRSPARTRGSSTVPSSPRGSCSKVSKESLAVARSLLRRSPPPPDLPRSCLYGMVGLSDGILGDNPRAGNFWDGGSTRHRSYNNSSSDFNLATVNLVLSCPKEPLAKAGRDTPPGVASSSSSSSSSSSFSSALEQEKKAKAKANADLLEQQQQQQQQQQKKAKEEEQAAATTTTTTTTTTIATPVPLRKKAARRVSWSPLVLAREEAAAAIRSYIKRVLEGEEYECRAAYDEAATRKFIERRAEARAERERGGRPAAVPPAPRRGAFFGLLAELDRKEWRGYKMWADSFPAFVPLGLTGNQVPAAWGGGGGGGSGDGGGCAMEGNEASGTGAPLGRVTTLGDYVRRMATDMLSYGQSRA